MTDTDIIKALECCLTVEIKGCKDCPYRHENCINQIMTDALDLINRQKAEIEELREINDCRTRDMPLFYATAIREFAENLTQDIKSHRLEMNLNGLKGTHRTDEMTYETIIDYIDNLLKEMTEEKT